MKVRRIIFEYVLQVIHKKKKNLFLSPILFFLSQFWKTVVIVRNLYQKKFAQPKKIAALTISIGNLVAGGVGKTPLVLLLAKYFADKKIGILSSGYRSKLKNKALLVKPQEQVPWQNMGDEPAMMKQYLPSAYFFVGKKQQYDRMPPIDIMLIDDGLQKQDIFKNFEIVMLNKNNLFGYQHFLPYGLLRQPLNRLKNCDLIVVNHVEDEKILADVTSSIQKYTSSPIIGTKPVMKGLKNSHNTFENMHKKNVAVFCSIGDPDAFCRMLQSNGYTIADTLFHLDHEPFSNQELQHFLKRSQANYLVCTKKDWIKLDISADLPIFYVEMELVVTAQHDQFENFIDKIQKKLYNLHEV